MRKKKEKRISRTPEELAQDIWLDFYRNLQERITQRIQNNDVLSPNEKKRLQAYIEHKKNLPDDEPIGGFKDLVLEYRYTVKPYLPWDEIKITLKGFKIADDAIQHLVFILKPTGIEYRMLADENEALKLFEEPAASIVAECNKKIQELALLVGKLENLYEQDDYYKQFWPLNLTIERIKYELAVNRAIIRIKHENDKKYLAIYCIDKDLKKSPQKHKYWNIAVSNALMKLNPYCHSDNCATGCRKTHQKAITAIAELLKILYPSIWKENVKTIASRIKQKDYRHI